jgi:hypothetical protein
MAFAGSANQRRTPGLHLTDIIGDIMLHTLGIDRRNGAFTEEHLAGFQLQGYLWEDVIMTGALRIKLQETGGRAFNIPDYAKCPEIALSLDGAAAFFIDPDAPPTPEELLGYIIMSPDGVGLEPWRGLEVKWTTTSVNKEPKREWFYQALGYLKGVGAAFGVRPYDVEWHVQYACGDYRGSGVIYEKWERSYTASEIDENWAMLAQHARDRAAEPEHPWKEWIG